jgi:excisionase family DNA binding protein
MSTQDVMTVTQAADYLGVTRQTIAMAAKRGDIGTRMDAIGTRTGWIYVFTRDELDTWHARPKHAGGRPKEEAGQLTPA